MRIAAVLWSGALGGAETFTVDLCRAMSALGVETSVVFVTSSKPLDVRLDAAGIPHTTLGLTRGKRVTLHPRRLARSVAALGADGALLPRAGYLTATLRLGGYRGRVVCVAHDAVFGLGPVSRIDRLVWNVDRASGFWASDVDVAVSDFALSHMRTQLHAPRLVRIYNGVDLDGYRSRPHSPRGEATTIACAARLIEGKGIDVLLRAFSEGPAQAGMQLRIAGDGPTQAFLKELAQQLRLNGCVAFTGPTVDIEDFWGACDVAVQPSDTFIESFGMAAVEAMASARPVIATANGALLEVVEDGVTGSIVAPGDVPGLSKAIMALGQDSERRRALGAAGRVRCEQLFDIRETAASYLSLFRR
jgi:glycosyltransferase involved in cell wall biosynthesis